MSEPMETMTLQQVATLFSVAHQTVRRWVRENNDFPRPFRPGGTSQRSRLIFDKAEVMSFLHASREVKDEEVEWT